MEDGKDILANFLISVEKEEKPGNIQKQILFGTIFYFNSKVIFI